MKIEELIEKVQQWATDRNIIDGFPPIKQAYKTLEECGELIEAASLRDYARSDFNSNLEDLALVSVMDAIGDITVTLIIQCAMQGVGFRDCLEGAYNEIKDRKGKIINGQFVKEQVTELSDSERGEGGYGSSDWRLLEVGEMVLLGDEHKIEGKWKSITIEHFNYYLSIYHVPHRRKI